jgi:hypothetical protein
MSRPKRPSLKVNIYNIENPNKSKIETVEDPSSSQHCQKIFEKDESSLQIQQIRTTASRQCITKDFVEAGFHCYHRKVLKFIAMVIRKAMMELPEKAHKFSVFFFFQLICVKFCYQIKNKTL